MERKTFQEIQDLYSETHHLIIVHCLNAHTIIPQILEKQIPRKTMFGQKILIVIYEPLGLQAIGIEIEKILNQKYYSVCITC